MRHFNVSLLLRPILKTSEAQRLRRFAIFGEVGFNFTQQRSTSSLDQRSQYEAVLAFPNANSLRARSTFQRSRVASRTYAFPRPTTILRNSKYSGGGPATGPSPFVFFIKCPF